MKKVSIIMGTLAFAVVSAAVISCHKEIGHKISDDEIIKAIENLRGIATLRRWYSEKEIMLNEYFANTITGETSDYDSVDLNLWLW